ncbi:terminase large subunit domain-containing protein [Streptomyces sp. NPDC001404]|uniref:terminase large subunit domain-containing protein n=1 Tax=Streptomyces sp. NPDC001404 TaxID=3364571 RepID=UPI0036BEB334
MPSTPKSLPSTSSSPLLTAKLAKLEELKHLQNELRQRTATAPRLYLPTARPKQLAPDDPRHHTASQDGTQCGCIRTDHDWMIWLVMAGRGWGKSLVGSHWLVHQAAKHPGSEWAVFAPTFRDTRKTCIEGSTGILSALSDDELDQYRRNELQVTLTNGSVIYGYSADQPERARGANLWGAWCDELGSWRYEQTWHEGLVPALRKGQHPRIVVTTTPRPTPLVRQLVGRRDGSVHLTRGSTWENAENLSPSALAELRRRYEGTRLGRQELEGELLDDIEGALWSRDDIDAARIGSEQVPDLVRVVVAVDPAVTSGEDADETGIVVVGEDGTGHGYVLADRSLRGSPHATMRAAVQAYRDFTADCVVGEVNNGGDYIGSLLKAVDPMVPYRAVRASRGKAIRAEPVAALYEQHRVHHVGLLAHLEDQLCTWTPEGAKSPDRMDALVWGLTELKGLSMGSWADAYGVARCQHCTQSFMAELHPDRCPHCRKQTSSAT